MTSRLETIGRDNWKDFLQSPTAVLMLGKTDCPACKAWTEELQSFLAQDQDWNDVRFGKMELDRGGLSEFKKANPWLRELDDLPYNVIYVNGERTKSFLGSGVERLVNRLRRVRESCED
jgi:hypothetical protein